MQQKECRFFGINAGWFDEQHLLGNNIIVEYFYNQLCLFVFNIPLAFEHACYFYLFLSLLLNYLSGYYHWLIWHIYSFLIEHLQYWSIKLRTILMLGGNGVTNKGPAEEANNVYVVQMKFS